MEFSKRLKHTRKLKQYTAQYMADELCISLRAYRMYEAGDRSPNLPALCKLADILNVSTDYLLGRDDYLKSLGVSVDELQ